MFSMCCMSLLMNLIFVPAPIFISDLIKPPTRVRVLFLCPVKELFFAGYSCILAELSSSQSWLGPCGVTGTCYLFTCLPVYHDVTHLRIVPVTDVYPDDHADRVHEPERLCVPGHALHPQSLHHHLSPGAERAET